MILIWRLMLGLVLSANLWAYSTKEIDQLETEFKAQINHAGNVIRIPLAMQYINHLGKKLARNAQLTQVYFFLVDSNEINAFAGPGGYIGVNSQLILQTANESELAAVMAHEMAHVRLEHLYRMIEHQKQMRIPMIASTLASIALGVLNPALGSGALMASLTGFAQDNIAFVRASEKEADRIGIDMLIKSGFDPLAMASFFKKMQANARYYYTANIPAILRTHPLDEDRIAEAENRSLHLIKHAHHNSLDYLFFKELIRTAVSTDPRQLIDYYKHTCDLHKLSSVCEYGYVLALLNANRSQEAGVRLKSLLQKNPDNLYIIIALSQAEIESKAYASAVQRLSQLFVNYPDNYAVIISYAHSLMMDYKAQEASIVLLKALRVFKNDLLLCEKLAHAQALSHKPAEAYFTKAQCYILEAMPLEALRQLKLARSMSQDNGLLKARIEAKLNEIIT